MIRKVQDIFSLKQDGVVGPKTLAALNGAPALEVFNRIKYAREKHYRNIVANRPGQGVNLNGWLNRLESIKFE